MIQIVNIGGNLLGVCDYSLRINGQELCKFQHSRPLGLSICLREAAEAYRKHREEEMIEYLRETIVSQEFTDCSQTGK